MYNLKNKKFGRLVAIKTCGSDKHHNKMWLCKCECGKKIKTNTQNLITGDTRSCGCIKFKFIDIMPRYCYTRLKGIILRNGKQFNLSAKFLCNLYKKQNGKCALSGLKIIFAPRWNRLSEQTASLDRIDSKKGYTKNNVQWVHKDINFMKQEYPQDLFLFYCKKISRKKS